MRATSNTPAGTIHLTQLGKRLKFYDVSFVFANAPESKGKIERINNVFDAIGLAAFSVMGTEVAFREGLEENMFLAVVLGMLTGVGGGMFRDVLTDTTPYIFKKHVYALASILGSCLYYLLRCYADSIALASAMGMILVVALRMLATRYRWSLPRIREEHGKR
jgi:uncharacterized membrane protein YeiH